MRRKLVVIIVLFAAAICIFVLDSLVGHKSDTPKVTNSNICLSFINYTENSQTQNAYNLFSTTLKKSISYGQWQSDMSTLNADFGAASPQLTSSSTTKSTSSSSTSGTVVSSLSGSASSSDTIRTYNLNNYGDIYTVNCAIAQTSSGYAIDSFSAALTTSSLSSDGQ